MAFIVLVVMLLAARLVHGESDTCALKQHVGFFDRDQDGIIDISETIEGLKALGIDTVEATTFATAIHTRLSAKTRPSGLASGSIFPIVVNNIKLAKHNGDTGVYDHEGRFVPEKFKAIFANHAHKRPNALDSSEIDELLNVNRQHGNYRNWLAASTEWKMLYQLGKDADGFLPSCHVKNVYDGSFFHQVAQNISSTQNTDT